MAMQQEDLSFQLRVAKSRLRETEDELYKAEEDMAALRSELRELQLMQSTSSQPGFNFAEQLRLAEQERDSAMADLKVIQLELQAEQRRTASETQRTSALAREKAELEKSLNSSRIQLEELSIRLAKQESLHHVQISEKVAADSEQENVNDDLSESEPHKKVMTEEVQKLVKDNERQAEHVRQLLIAVERLDKVREKLLSEIDKQSLQLELLFSENAGLTAGLKETAQISAYWEAQVKELLSERDTQTTQIVQLRHSIAHQGINNPQSVASGDQTLHLPGVITSESQELEILRSKLEESKSMNLKLSADNMHAIQSLHNLKRLYRKALGGLEGKLKSLRQEKNSM